jgi:hypothetical protein
MSHLFDPGVNIRAKGWIVGCDFQSLPAAHRPYGSADPHNWHGAVESFTYQLDSCHAKYLQRIGMAPWCLMHKCFIVKVAGSVTTDKIEAVLV